ncbi:hypothetical protein F5ESL0261_01905 [Lactobacillus sp. ESL0261]|nr:hypothetical protein F5ESL0261_01905 [Lactobacillus sp. ESL0261]
MMKFSSKLLKSTVTMLSLITLTGTITPIIAKPTIVQAKKAKKKHYVTAKNKHQFKFGYAYTYNKKKHCYIGHKMSKKERQKFNLPKEQKVQKAKSNYDVPKISSFTDHILNKYNLSGDRWAKTTITYNNNKLPNEQQRIVENAIQQINELNIVTLIKTKKKKANIIIKLANKSPKEPRLGYTETEGTGQKYNGLFVYKQNIVTLYTDEINKATGDDYKLTVNQVTIHEIGHALGLDHNTNQSEIMYPTFFIKKVNTIDSTHVAIDQDYINGLAILYQN